MVLPLPYDGSELVAATDGDAARHALGSASTGWVGRQPGIGSRVSVVPRYDVHRIQHPRGEA